MGTTNTLDLNNRITALEKGGGGGTSDGASRADIAAEFSATTNYTAGCFVYYGGKLYQFNTDHSAGAWDPTDVVEANVTDQVVSNAAAIAGLTASDVAYDNTASGLTATDVQGAVDELNSSVRRKLKSGYNTSSQLGSWWVATGDMSGEVTYSVDIPDDAIYIAVKVTIVDTMDETFYVPADLIKAFPSGAYYPLELGSYNPTSAFYALIGIRLYSNKAALSHQNYGTSSQSKEKSIQLFYLYN